MSVSCTSVYVLSREREREREKSTVTQDIAIVTYTDTVSRILNTVWRRRVLYNRIYQMSISEQGT